MGEKITEYATETAIRRAGRLHHRARLLPQQRGLRRGVPARARARRRTRAHVDFGFHFSTANELHIKELGEYVKQLRRHLVQVLHEFQGRGRALPRPGRHRRRLLLRPAEGIGARRAADRSCATPRTSKSSTASAARCRRAGGNTLKDWSASKPRDHRVGAGVARHVPRRGARRARVLPAHLVAQGARRDPLLAPALQGRDRRDLPALPHAHRGLRPRRHGQGEPAVPHEGRPGSDLGSASSTAPSTSSPPTTTRARRSTKDKPLWLASQGFPGTASMLPVMLSEGYHKRKLPLQRICQLLGSVPARDLRPRAAQGLAQPRRGRRLHARRPEQGARAARGRLRLLRRLQPARRLESQRLAGTQRSRAASR